MAEFKTGRKELYDEIWSTSVMKTAEKYEISYTRLISSCRKHHIPTPPPGYSTKLEFGKKVERTPLPESDEDVVIIKMPAETRKEKREHIPAIAVETIVQESSVPDEDDQDKFPLMHYGDNLRKNREELYRKVWEKPISEVAKNEHIADATLRNRCKKLEVPIPDRGYWAKLKAGKYVYKKELGPMTLPDFPKPHTGQKRKLHIETNALSFMQKEGRVEILKLASVLRVGGPNSAMLDNIQKLYVAFREWHKFDRDIYIPDIIPRKRNEPEAEFLTNEISPKTAKRAFHILDALTRALLPYGGSFTCTDEIIFQNNRYNKKYHYWFNVNGERVYFTISEGKGQVVHAITQEERIETLRYKEEQRKGYFTFNPTIPKYDEIWNGRLKMTIAGNTTFEDCKSYMLEDRIGEIFIALYEAFYPQRLNTIKELEQLQKEVDEYNKQQEEESKKQLALDLYNAEIEKTKALMNKAADYEAACSIRRYIEGVKNNPESPYNNPDWLDWANKKADWLDPTIGREDELLGKRQHELNASQKELNKRC